MVAMIAQFVLPALFAASGLFALATLALSWRHYGHEFAAIRAQLAASAEVEAVWVRLAAGTAPAADAAARPMPAAQSRRAPARPALPRPALRQPALRVAA
jgi:hypothetical protein